MTGTVEGASAALSVDGLNVFYGKSQVTFDFTLAVRPGEVVTILGRNGAGKTSIVMGLAGAVVSAQKSLRLFGTEIGRMNAQRRVREGLIVVPSGSRAFPDLTVQENLAIMRGRSKGKRGWTISEAYEFFPKLAMLSRSKGSQLSGGERQMLAVARAMVAGPSVLMLDEPSEGLAPLVLAEIGRMLGELTQSGVSVLLTEQNYRFALGISQRAYFVEKGQAVWEGTAHDAGSTEVVGRYLGV